MTTATPMGGSIRDHVLHVTDCYDGGVSRAINHMVVNAPHVHHSLAYHGDETPPPGMFRSEMKVVGGRLARMAEFRRILRRTRPSLVHLHSSWAGGFVRLGGKPPAPVIYQPHCYKFVDPTLGRPSRGMYQLAERALLPNTNVTVVLSHAERLAAEAIGATRLAAVPNVPFLSPGEVSAEGMSRRRVLMMGRLAAQKHPEFFLEIVRECRRLLPDMEAVWIGDGEEELRALLEGEGIVVTGWLDQDGVEEVFSQGGVYAHSARYEGLPLAVLDAAQRGVAVVLRRIDSFVGIDELQQLDSPSEMAAEVLRLVQDRTAYREAVEDGQRLLEKHSPQRQSEALRSLYALVGVS